MKKTPEPNISNLEIDIENKMSAAYLYSLASCCQLKNPILLKEHFTKPPSSKQNINSKK